MKKSIFTLCILSGIICGCTKTDRPQAKNTAPSSHKYKPMSTAMPAKLTTFEENTMNWNDLQTGYNDQNTRYNKAKLYLSIGLTEVVKDPVIAAWIISEAKQHEDNVFYFDNLFEHFPGTKAIMEAAVDPSGEMTGWSFDQVQQQMQYEDFDIKASIYLTNTEIADPSLKPMVTPGYDILQEDAQHPSDVVLGWYIDDKNRVSRINLWQEIVSGVTAPIFAIDGRATNKPPLVLTGVPTGLTDPNVAERAASNQLYINEFVIGKRYENTGNSEFAIAGKCMYFPYQGTAPLMPGCPNPIAGSWNFLKPNGCGTLAFPDMEIASVAPSVINSWSAVATSRYFCWSGTSVTNNFNPYYSESDCYAYLITSGPAAGNYQTATGRKRLYFNTYEADGWPTSSKPLSPASINGVALGLKGKMGSYNEWYLFDPYVASQWINTNAFYPFATSASYPHIFWNHPAKGGRLVLSQGGWCQ